MIFAVLILFRFTIAPQNSLLLQLISFNAECCCLFFGQIWGWSSTKERQLDFETAIYIFTSLFHFFFLSVWCAGVMQAHEYATVLPVSQPIDTTNVVECADKQQIEVGGYVIFNVSTKECDMNFNLLIIMLVHINLSRGAILLVLRSRRDASLR